MTDEESWSAADLATLLADGDLELATLTDDEIAAVVGEAVDDGFYVDLPTFSALDATGRAVARSAAARSLRARGLVAPDPDDDADAVVVGDLATVLQFLTGPSVVVIADVEHHGSAPVQRAWLAIPGLAVLDHQPDGTGLHRFVVRGERTAVAALVDALDPDGRAAGDGEPIEERDGPTSWAPVEHALASAQALTRVFSTRPAGEQGAVNHELLAVAGTDGVWLLGAAHARDDGPPGRRAVRVSRSTLASVCLALLGEDEGT